MKAKEVAEAATIAKGKFLSKKSEKLKGAPGSIFAVEINLEGVEGDSPGWHRPMAGS